MVLKEMKKRLKIEIYKKQELLLYNTWNEEARKSKKRKKRKKTKG